MPKRIEEPVTVADAKWRGDGATRTTHPAFAQIGAARVQGDTYLYGSEFKHYNAIRVRIATSELLRDLSHDTHFEGRQYIEVELSEAQWATFISTLNMGSGVPCTLLRFDGEDVPGLPPPPKRQEQFGAEMKRTLLSTSEGLAELREMVQNSSLSAKAKSAMLMKIETTGYGIGTNLEFVEKTFGKHMEKVTESAKVEVEAYVTGVVARTGLAVLQGKPPPFELPAPEKD